MTLLYEWLARATEDCGNAKALVYRDNYLSWRGLKHRVDRRAQEFEAMGVRKGDWVGLMLGNVPDFVILALGLSRLGVTVVPIDPTTSSREFDMVMDTVPLRALITRPKLLLMDEPFPAAPRPSPWLWSSRRADRFPLLHRKSPRSATTSPRAAGASRERC